MIVAMHQPHYLPWLRYMHKLASCDLFVILDDVQFTKNGWQNRNKIKGAQGPVCLTVPVRDATFKPINAVEIDPQSTWREKHWKSLWFTYGKAPFFRQFGPVFEQALAKRWDVLAPLSCHLIQALCEGFGIHTSLVLSSTLGVGGSGTERLVRICQVLGADRYLTGAYAATNHMDERMFADQGIRVEIQGWECPRYRQQFPGIGFLPDLSGVDLLFNEGPGSLRVLRRAAKEKELVSLGTQRMFD
jgi:hypothetical protein